MKTSIKFKQSVVAAVLGIFCAGAAVAGDAPKNMNADAISLKKAIEIAKQHTGAVPVEAERDSHMGSIVYEIELAGEQGKEFHTVIDADTGEIIKSREHLEDDHEDLQEQASFLAGVKNGQYQTLETALAAAEAKHAGQVYEIELDDDYGISYEVKLLAADGSKVKTRISAE
ncbi:PepSY domain-containing protein [Shewanella submarina]|uniref:PepSY domain-containing protein n=1 Tax=Shewanella submarina TaxID=2016376 RepID=A0ABV7GKV8_9GAMM|nr:PepSY domain-containing protein [Shewanella submarina]MCL1036322.1 PepSY domain-containing protein [Shewanella submarina]